MAGAQRLDSEMDPCVQTVGRIQQTGLGPKQGQYEKWPFVCLQMAFVHESGWVPLEPGTGAKFR